MQEEGFPESPAMSFEFRLKLFALCLGNILVMILWQKVCLSVSDQAADFSHTAFKRHVVWPVNQGRKCIGELKASAYCASRHSQTMTLHGEVYSGYPCMYGACCSSLLRVWVHGRWHVSSNPSV